MKFRLYTAGKDGPEEFASERDLIEVMRAAGVEQTGRTRSPELRRELQGRPMFKMVAGPMWDRDGIRYEDVATNRELSE